MFPALTVSLACLAVSCLIGLLILAAVRETRRRKREKEEELKRRVTELTGQDFVKGHTTVKDLEKMYGKKG